jgi:transposase InsO family protein
MRSAAAERGALRPLPEILAAIRDKLPGEVVGVEVEQKSGRRLYEFRVADTRGRLLEAYVDARTSTVERIRRRNHRRRRRAGDRAKRTIEGDRAWRLMNAKTEPVSGRRSFGMRSTAMAGGSISPRRINPAA